jgi:hypothetical protein
MFVIIVVYFYTNQMIKFMFISLTKFYPFFHLIVEFVNEGKHFNFFHYLFLFPSFKAFLYFFNFIIDIIFLFVISESTIITDIYFFPLVVGFINLLKIVLIYFYEIIVVLATRFKWTICCSILMPIQAVFSFSS